MQVCCKDYAMQAQLATLQIPGVVAALSSARCAEVWWGEGLADHTLSYTTALQGLFQPAPPLPASTSPCNGSAQLCNQIAWWSSVTRNVVWCLWHKTGPLWHKVCIVYDVKCYITVVYFTVWCKMWCVWQIVSWLAMNAFLGPCERSSIYTSSGIESLALPTTERHAG